MRGDEKILELSASIYEAAVEPTLWPAVLERLADSLGRASISLITSEDFDRPLDVWLANYDPSRIEARLRHYARPEVNPSVRALMQIEPLSVVPRKRFITDREFEKDPACRVVLMAQGCTMAASQPSIELSRCYQRSRSIDPKLCMISPDQRFASCSASRRTWRMRCGSIGQVSVSQVHQHQAEAALN
jgi:hypothetical protein